MHSGGATTYYRRSLFQELGEKELISLPERLAKLTSRRSRSRTHGTVWMLRGRTGRVNFICRRYHHGGLWGRLAGTTFVGHERMLQELAMYEYGWKSGVPTCQTAALRIEHRLGPLCSGYLVTVAIENVRNLHEMCRAQQGRAVPMGERIEISKAVARALQKMHDNGIYHRDMNANNILVRQTPEGPEAFVIDFDKAILMSSVPLDARMHNLLRLDRSVLKWPSLRATVSVSDRLRLVRDYLSAYPQWRSQWKRIVALYRTRHLRHRLTRVDDTVRESLGLEEPPA
jgi:tRNA A-37 threonylcarbamoyl transferase component Bud32